MGRTFQRINITIPSETLEQIEGLKGPADTTSGIIRKGIEMLATEKIMETRAQYCFELGRIMGAIDARVERLRPGFLNNLSAYPYNWKPMSVFIWNKAKRANKYVRELMETFEAMENPGKVASPREEGAWMFGYHREQKIARDMGVELPDGVE